MQVFNIKDNTEVVKINSDRTPIMELLRSHGCYTLIDDISKSIFLWIGQFSSNSKKTIGFCRCQEMKINIGEKYDIISIFENSELNEFKILAEDTPSDGKVKKITLNQKTYDPLYYLSLSLKGCSLKI